MFPARYFYPIHVPDKADMLMNASTVGNVVYNSITYNTGTRLLTQLQLHCTLLQLLFFFTPLLEQDDKSNSVTVCASGA